MTLNEVISGVRSVKLGAVNIFLVFPHVLIFGVEVDGAIAVDAAELKAKFEAEGWDYEAFIKTFKTTAQIPDAKDETVIEHLQKGLTEYYRLQQDGVVPEVPEALKHQVNGVNVALASLAQRSFGVTPVAADGKKVSWDDTHAAVSAALVVPEEGTSVPETEVTEEPVAETTSETPAEQEKVVPDAEPETTPVVEEEASELPAVITNNTDLAAVSGVIGKIVTMNAAAIKSNQVISELIQNQMVSFSKLAELQSLNTSQLEAANDLFTGIQQGLAQAGVAALPETV